MRARLMIKMPPPLPIAAVPTHYEVLLFTRHIEAISAFIYFRVAYFSFHYRRFRLGKFPHRNFPTLIEQTPLKSLYEFIY